MSILDQSLDGTYFRPPQLPAGPFMVEDQDGNIDGPFDPGDFVTDDQGVMIHSPESAHPLFLRVVEQQGNEITAVDGEGTMWHYTLLPLRTA